MYDENDPNAIHTECHNDKVCLIKFTPENCEHLAKSMGWDGFEDLVHDAYPLKNILGRYIEADSGDELYPTETPEYDRSEPEEVPALAIAGGRFFDERVTVYKIDGDFAWSFYDEVASAFY